MTRASVLKNFLKKMNYKIDLILSKIEVRKLFTFLILIFGIILISVFVISRYKTVYSAVYQERIEKLNYMSDFAIEVLKEEAYYVKMHKLTLQQAQAQVIGVFKDVHFENSDYIWIYDYDGIILYHPNPNMIGKNTKDSVDIKGTNFGAKMIDLPKKYGSVYISYDWPKLGQNNNITYPKVSYVVAFSDWKWIIGMGIYVDDIKIKVLHSMLKSLYPILFGAIIAMLIFRYILWVTVVTPIEDLADKSLRLANNDLTVTLPEETNNTEIGKLYQAFGKFVKFFKEKRDNEKKLSLIYDNIENVLITVNSKGEIQSGNLAIEKMFGYSLQEIIGANVNLLISPTLFEENFDNLKNDKHGEGKYEILGIRKNEDLFNIEINVNEFLYNDETLFILVIRDITEQKEVEKMKNDFISVISHELRTPLTAVRASLGLLLSGAFPTLPDKAENLIEIANKNSLRLIDLINDILDIDKIAAGKMDFNLETTNISGIIKSTIAINKPYGKQYKVFYNFVDNLNPNETFIVDKSRFMQVLTNLLSNATKFSPEHSVVTVSTEKKNNKVIISIKDSGSGIPQEFRDKVFDKFTQVDSSDTRKKGGTGLGLSICKSLVERMNGQIGFESEVGHGTTFRIEFPTKNSIG